MHERPQTSGTQDPSDDSKCCLIDIPPRKTDWQAPALCRRDGEVNGHCFILPGIRLAKSRSARAYAWTAVGSAHRLVLHFGNVPGAVRRSGNERSSGTILGGFSLLIL